MQVILKTNLVILSVKKSGISLKMDIDANIFLVCIMVLICQLGHKNLAFYMAKNFNKGIFFFFVSFNSVSLMNSFLLPSIKFLFGTYLAPKAIQVKKLRPTFKKSMIQ